MPHTLAQALADRINGKHWQAAFNVEANNLIESGTLQPAALPKYRRAIGCRTLFSKKLDVQGTEKFKVRIVAQGFSQRAGIDYSPDETYMATASQRSSLIIDKLAQAFQFKTYHIDFKAAYLNAVPEEELYMRTPPGMESFFSEDFRRIRRNGGTPVLRLCKALYGLKQSAACWGNTLIAYLKVCGFTQSKVDPCLLFKHNADLELRAALVLHGDDIKLCTTPSEHASFYETLSSKFQTSWVPLKVFLGTFMEFTRDSKGQPVTRYSNRVYIDKILNDFRMADCKPAHTPSAGVRLVKETDESKINSKFPMRALVGELLWLSKIRPDITYATNMLARHSASPGPSHIEAGKRILRYLKKTRDYAMVSSWDPEVGL